MRCKSTAAIAAAIAMGMAISTPGYAQHRHGGHWGHHGGHWRHHHHGGWGAAAGGFAVGALIGSAHDRREVGSVGVEQRRNLSLLQSLAPLGSIE